MFLYHYFDKKTGPFMNMSELAMEEANNLLNRIKEEKLTSQCAQRDKEYMFRRRMYEDIIRKEFLKKAELLIGIYHIIW